MKTGGKNNLSHNGQKFMERMSTPGRFSDWDSVDLKPKKMKPPLSLKKSFRFGQNKAKNDIKGYEYIECIDGDVSDLSDEEDTGDEDDTDPLVLDTGFGGLQNRVLKELNYELNPNPNPDDTDPLFLDEERGLGVAPEPTTPSLASCESIITPAVASSGSVSTPPASSKSVLTPAALPEGTLKGQEDDTDPLFLDEKTGLGGLQNMADDNVNIDLNQSRADIAQSRGNVSFLHHFPPGGNQDGPLLPQTGGIGDEDDTDPLFLDEERGFGGLQNRELKELDYELDQFDSRKEVEALKSQKIVDFIVKDLKGPLSGQSDMRNSPNTLSIIISPIQIKMLNQKSNPKM
eukprot:CAMPEP_0119053034 /NCGR_PEP_ID=MMETSP1177-20130426/74147_1 /TAXON_ID=2985 /ORGANISM="Ochromonas sp, Strain CCMP1899" /LENGTH=345 /DNA_ID=CAMNT_0007032829 /DNA_START=1654 /DNA_END=2692 /DNA_ORIENTATION=+